MPISTERKTRDERRETVLDAAREVFAHDGLSGASTEEIAAKAGISQPYVFRLFGTKKELFKAVVARCFRETMETFQRAAEGVRGVEALRAMGAAYANELLPNRLTLRIQMQAYAACDDPEIRDLVRAGFGDLFAYVERVGGDTQAASLFFAQGMLLNVIASIGAEGDEPWLARLQEGCLSLDEPRGVTEISSL
jgi:AcrR family transcriptional regulator